MVFSLKATVWEEIFSNLKVWIGLSKTEKRKFCSVQKLIEWVLVAISSCSIGPFSLQKFFTEDILYAFVLSPGFISENFVLSEIDVEKKQVNTGITRIFRQHQFIESRNVNDSYMNSNIKLCFLYQFSFPEIVAGSEITIWMDIQYYWQFLQLKPDIINDLCQSMVQFKWQSNCRQFKWGWTVTILFQTDWEQTNGMVKKKTFSDVFSLIPSSTLSILKNNATKREDNESMVDSLPGSWRLYIFKGFFLLWIIRWLPTSKMPALWQIG